MSLRSKLASLGNTLDQTTTTTTATTSSSSTHSNNDNNDKGTPSPSPSPSNQSHNNQTAAAAVAQRRMLLSNPQSLLARDPLELSQMLSLPSSSSSTHKGGGGGGGGGSLREVQNLRNRVAETIIMDEIVGHGMESSRIIRDVQSLLNDDTNDGNDVDGRQGGGGGDKRKRRKRVYTSMVGGTTALDRCLHSSENDNDNDNDGPTTTTTTTATCIPTGSQSLDRLLSPPSLLPNNNNTLLQTTTTTTTTGTTALGGGLPTGIITEISGPSGCGKTQLALSLAANALLPVVTEGGGGGGEGEKWRVHYLAAGGGSSSLYPLARRFRQLCHARLLERRRIAKESAAAAAGVVVVEDGEGVLERMGMEVVEDGYGLLASLIRLERGFLRGKEDDDGHWLVVLDSASGALSPLLYGGNDGGAGAAVMNEVLVVLRRLARCTVWVTGGGGGSGDGSSGVVGQRMGMGRRRRRRIAVLVTNGVVSSRGGMVGRGGRRGGTQRYRPALGESWRVADVRLQLEILGDVYHEHEDRDGDGNAVVPGMVRSTMRRVDARLEQHYAKACYRSLQQQRYHRGGTMGREEGRCEFGIRVSGIVDSDGLVV